MLPLYEKDPESSSRSIPVRFEMAPVVKKPGKNAGEPELKEYRRQKKEKNLSVQFVFMVKEVRGRLNLGQVADGPDFSRRLLSGSPLQRVDQGPLAGRRQNANPLVFL